MTMRALKNRFQSPRVQLHREESEAAKRVTALKINTLCCWSKEIRVFSQLKCSTAKQLRNASQSLSHSVLVGFLRV